MNKTDPHTRVHVLILLALTGLLYFTNLGGYALWPPDEPRFAEVTREMMLTGDYLVPRVNGEPYNEKSPLLFWAQAAVSLPFGGITETTARIPVALAGLLTVLLTYFVGRRMLDVQTAFVSAVILATTQRFWWQARFAQIDMLLTLCLCVAFVLLWLWHTDRRRVYLVGFYLAIAAGLLAKGPPAILYPALAITVFYWKRKDERKGLYWLPGFAVALVIVLLWLIPARHAASVGEVAAVSEGVSQNLVKQTLGRFVSGVSHPNPPWYYLVNLPLDLFPWSFFLPWTVVWFRRERPKNDAMRYLLSWIVPAFIFFTISTEKRALYLLPMYPAVALVLGQSLVALGNREPGRWRRRTLYAWVAILVLTAIFPWVIPMTPLSEYHESGVIVFSLIGILGAGYTLLLRNRKGAMSMIRSVAIPCAALFLAVSVVVFPIVDESKSAKEFCAPIREAARADAEFELLMIEFSREQFVYYAEHFHEELPQGTWGSPEDIDDYASLESRQINHMRRAAEGAELGPVSSWTEDDVRRLQDAIDSATAEEDEYTDRDLQIREYVRSALRERLLGTDAPVFVIVQDGDWRWISGLLPEVMEEFSVIREQGVGSRDVLLLGNRGAVQLADQL